jgi:hypothetical protein
MGAGGLTLPKQYQTPSPLLRRPPSFARSTTYQAKQRLPHDHHLHYWVVFARPYLPRSSPPKMIAKPNKRRAKGIQKTRNEHSGCTGTFSSNLGRQWHTKEQHSHSKSCCISGCKWTTRRMVRPRTHLNNVHRSQGISSPLLTSDFGLSH